MEEKGGLLYNKAVLMLVNLTYTQNPKGCSIAASFSGHAIQTTQSPQVHKPVECFHQFNLPLSSIHSHGVLVPDSWGPACGNTKVTRESLTISFIPSISVLLNTLTGSHMWRVSL